MKKFLAGNLLYIAWMQSIMAVAGSLFFSEIMKFPPCTLCWYQRIFMYPLVIILGVGMIRRDKRVYTYVLPLSILGLCISFYHNLLYFKILPEGIQQCAFGISCTTKYFGLFGFITIPLLSLLAFAIITVCVGVYAINNRKI